METFLLVVEEVLVPAMHQFGYNYLGEFPGSVGFEARDESVKHRAWPDDPDSLDEIWITYNEVSGFMRAAQPLGPFDGLDVATDAELRSAVTALAARLVYPMPDHWV
jgi:hypothetical protein